ncbi:MAG: EamA family transporter [Pseudolabrys sp.]|jgi:drug/metabolite transporter (DMT)-like permease
MTPGIGLALGAMLCFGVGDLIYKRAAASGADPGQFIMLQAWAYCPAITLYAWMTGTLEPHISALWGSLAGLFSLVAFYNFARSLQGGAVSTNAPIFRLNFTLTAALAVLLLGETLTPAKIAALACALLAVWLLLAEPGAARPNMRALARVLVATAALGLANLFLKFGLRAGALPETMVTTQAWAFSSTATLMILLRDRRLRLAPAVWRFSVPAAITLVVAFVLLMHALALGAVSVLAPVTQMSFVFTAIVGTALFGETLNWRKRFGLVAGVASLALFAVS